MPTSSYPSVSSTQYASSYQCAAHIPYLDQFSLLASVPAPADLDTESEKRLQKAILVFLSFSCHQALQAFVERMDRALKTNKACFCDTESAKALQSVLLFMIHIYNIQCKQALDEAFNILRPKLEQILKF